ncbi:MAG: metallophosphoesterase [Clostridia bacterium]|nr:metallophosphoesterase [Clostridia bacterium]
MSIYAISDLHLSFQTEKPMNKFGNVWADYEEKMKFQWNEVVEKSDIVLIPGDVSWATYLQSAVQDFRFIDELNGLKLISKGNHDYWWETLNKLNEFIKENEFSTVQFLHNTCFDAGDYVICSAKGYDLSVEEKLQNRECIRLNLSLAQGAELGKPIIAMLHYPPFDKSLRLYPDIKELLEKYNVKVCIYGHLHAEGHKKCINENIDGVEYKLVSADFLDFMPVKIA